MYRNIPFSEKATSFDHFPVLQNNNAPLMFRLIPVEQYDLARMSDTSLALDVIIQEILSFKKYRLRNQINNGTLNTYSKKRIYWHSVGIQIIAKLSIEMSNPLQ